MFPSLPPCNSVSLAHVVPRALVVKIDMWAGQRRARKYGWFTRSTRIMRNIEGCDYVGHAGAIGRLMHSSSFFPKESPKSIPSIPEHPTAVHVQMPFYFVLSS